MEYRSKSPTPSTKSFGFSSDHEEGNSSTQGDDKSGWTNDSADQDIDTRLFEKKNKNYTALFKFSGSNNEGWQIEKIQDKIKNVELQFTIQAKIFDKKVGKEINSNFLFSLRIDEPNIQSKIEEFAYKQNINLNDWERLGHYVHLKFNDFLLFHLIQSYLKEIENLTVEKLTNMVSAKSEVTHQALKEKLEFECRKLRYEIQENFEFEDSTIFDNSSQFDFMKKNLLDVLEWKRKNLLLKIELTKVD